MEIKRVALILLVSVVIFSLSFDSTLGAVIPGAPETFGGKILFIIPCTCSLGVLIEVGPPKGGTFLFQLGVSQLYQNYSLLPGRWVLGITSAGTLACITGFPPYCAPAGRGSVIRKVGTS